MVDWLATMIRVQRNGHARRGEVMMITIAEISLSLPGTYRRTCGLVGVDVVKILDNDVKIV